MNAVLSDVIFNEYTQIPQVVGGTATTGYAANVFTSGAIDRFILVYHDSGTASTRYELCRIMEPKRDDPSNNKPTHSDAMQYAFLSEAVLAKEWDTPEEDAAWADL